MKTSAQWWSEVKQDPILFNTWLQKQYRGEVTASRRIMEVAKMAESPLHVEVLHRIAKDEARHASWVKELLEARDIEVIDDSMNAENRYWATVKLSIKDFFSAMAVAAHAEAMRLERIKVIAMDDEAPEDVRTVFLKILADEVFHEEAFRTLAGEDAMMNTQASAEEGKRVLGLVA